MSQIDHGLLRNTRSHYYLTQYDKVIASDDSDLHDIIKEFVYLSHIELNEHDKVIDSIDDNSSIGLQSIKLYSQFRVATSDEEKDLIMDNINEWMLDDMTNTNQRLQHIICKMYFELNEYEKCLTILNKNRNNLECLYLMCFIYFKLNRYDLSEKIILQMEQVDDDDCLTILASCYHSILSENIDKISNAFFSLQELADKFGSSILIQNACGVCSIHRKQLKEAFKYFKQARDVAVKQNITVYADTLINTSIVLHHMNKANISNKVQEELYQAHPNHEWIKAKEDLYELFDSAAKTHIQANKKKK